VSDAERRDLLSGARVLAYPSRYEGFGLVSLEAMGAGVPVVASRAGALPEVLGDAAVLVDPDDVAGLAAALEQVSSDEELRADLVRRGRERVARYSWNRAGDQFLDLYRSLV
jgi:glycosyltransferase involved in cell wall biosynthesis